MESENICFYNPALTKATKNLSYSKEFAKKLVHQIIEPDDKEELQIEFDPNVLAQTELVYEIVTECALRGTFARAFAYDPRKYKSAYTSFKEKITNYHVRFKPFTLKNVHLIKGENLRFEDYVTGENNIFTIEPPHEKKPPGAKTLTIGGNTFSYLYPSKLRKLSSEFSFPDKFENFISNDVCKLSRGDWVVFDIFPNIPPMLKLAYDTTNILHKKGVHCTMMVADLLIGAARLRDDCKATMYSDISKFAINLYKYCKYHISPYVVDNAKLFYSIKLSHKISPKIEFKIQEIMESRKSPLRLFELAFPYYLQVKEFMGAYGYHSYSDVCKSMKKAYVENFNLPKKEMRRIAELIQNKEELRLIDDNPNKPQKKPEERVVDLVMSTIGCKSEIETPETTTNFPAGEVFVFPKLESFNGLIKVPNVCNIKGLPIKDFVAKFENGILNLGKVGRHTYNFINANFGISRNKKFVGEELGIGFLDSWLTGCLSSDEKILGTLHIGMNVLMESKHIGHFDVILDARAAKVRLFYKKDGIYEEILDFAKL